MKKFTLFLTLVLITTFAYAQAPFRASKQDILNRTQTTTSFDKLPLQMRSNIMGNMVNGAVRFNNSMTANATPICKTPKKAEAEAPVFDPSTIIAEQPEGEVKLYERSGMAFLVFFGYVMQANQGGSSIEITHAPDGKTVYMKDIISQALTDTWVKGTKEGNKIHIPMNQVVLYDEGAGFGAALCKLDYGTSKDQNGDEIMTYLADFSTTEMTFTVNEEDGTISLDGTDEMNEDGMPTSMMGYIYTDNYSWAGYGDYQSVYIPFNGVKTEIPEELNTEDWSYMYYDQEGYRFGNIVKIAVDGDKMYIAGLNSYDATSAIVGTINGNKVTFKSDQFLNTTEDGFILYACGAKGHVEETYDPDYDQTYRDWVYEYQPEFTYTYDAEKKTITSEDDDVFVVNGGKGIYGISYFTTGSNPVFGLFKDVAATPADPEVVSLHDDYLENYGYNYPALNVKTEDVDGNFINPAKTSYILYVKVDDEVEPFVFYADEYYGFAEMGIEELTEVPYNFVSYDEYGYEDIALGGSMISYYPSGFDDYGVQTIYYGGGERRESNIAWYSVTSGIKGVTGNKAENAITAIYSIDGKRLATPQKGLNIMKMADGSVRKVMVK